MADGLHANGLLDIHEHAKTTRTKCEFSAFLALGAPIFVTLISNYGLRRYIARLEKREKDLMMQLRRQNQNEQNSVKLLLSLFGVRYGYGPVLNSLRSTQLKHLPFGALSKSISEKGR